MKLKRFDSMNENRNMYFVDNKNKEKSIEEQKFEIIEKLSQNWSEKLKIDYLVPRSLYKYSLDELKQIEEYYLGESFHMLDGTPIPVDNRHRPIMEKQPEYDYDKIGELMKEHGWGDIMNTEVVDDFENSSYYHKNHYWSSEEYVEDFNKYMYDVSTGMIQESADTVCTICDTVAQLKEKYLSHEAVENIRVEEDGDKNVIVFDCKCETDIQGVNEVNGYEIRYNLLCQVDNPPPNPPEFVEKSEEEMIAEAKQLRETQLREYVDELKKLNS